MHMKMHCDEKSGALYLRVQERVPAADLKHLDFKVA
jgi:hypothetical protein